MLKRSGKISLYLKAMSMENSLLQSYRALFIAIETILFAFVFAIIKSPAPNLLIVLIGAIGLIICILWIIVCYAKSKDVDSWRDSLIRESKNHNELEEKFEYLKKPGLSLAGGKFSRICFNYLIPSLMLIIWIGIIIVIIIVQIIKILSFN